MQEKLGVEEDPDEQPRVTDEDRELRSGPQGLVLGRETLPCNLFEVEPAVVLDPFPKPLLNDFLWHVRDVVKYRIRWDQSDDSTLISRPAKGQQRFGPRNISDGWTYGPSENPPPYGEKAQNQSYVAMIKIIDRMIDWTGRACGLPMDYWLATHETVSYTHLTLPTIYSV